MKGIFTTLAPKYFFFIGCFLTLIGCGSGGGSNNSIPDSLFGGGTPTGLVSGVVEKGPFAAGATVRIQPLDSFGRVSGSTTVATVGSRLGNYSFVPSGSDPLLITATGRFRQEVTGLLSSSEISLSLIYLPGSESANVNLLTHFVSARVLRLVEAGSTSYTEATQQSEAEFLSAFSEIISSSGESDFSSLSIFNGPQSDGSAYLLLLSSIFSQYEEDRAPGDSDLPTLVEQLQADFGRSGSFVDAEIRERLKVARSRVQPDELEDVLIDWLSGRTGYSIPDINTVLDNDSDGVVNAFDPDDDNDGIADGFDDSPYNINDPPVISGSPQAEISAHHEYSFAPSSFDRDGDELSFSIQNQPPWLDFDTTNGTLSGTPTNDDAGVWPNIQISVTDGEYSESLDPFSITVSTYPWIPLADMPTSRYGLSAATSGSSVYVLGGRNNGLLSKLEIYDASDSSWESGASMQIARRGHTSHIIGGTLFAIGGQNNSGEISSVEAYDLETDSWSFVSPLSVSRSLHASCEHDGKIYVFGGFTEDGVENITHTMSLKTAEVYDPLTDTWTPIASMSGENWGAFCVERNNLIYLVGGAENANGYQIYAPDEDQWIGEGSLVLDRRYGFGVVSLRNEIYVVGGSTNSLGSTNLVEAFDPVTKQSRYAEPMTGARRYEFGIVVSGDGFIVFGGRNNTGSGLSTVERYDPDFE